MVGHEKLWQHSVDIFTILNTKPTPPQTQRRLKLKFKYAIQFCFRKKKKSSNQQEYKGEILLL